MGIVTVPGADLFTDRRGARPSLVLVHGFGGDLHTWDELWPALAPDRAALRYDLRGFGRSTAHAREPFSHAEDLANLLDAVAAPRVDLVGVSMGGAIALGVALDRPDRVRSLTLVSPAIAGWEWSGEWRALWQPITQAARDGRLEEARRLWWRHPIFDSVRDGPSAARVRDEVMHYSGEHWVRDDQRPVFPDIEHLHQLALPVLLLTGGRDCADFRLMADLIEASAQAVERIDVPLLGHLVHREDPAGCAARIAAFLARHADGEVPACPAANRAEKV